MSECPIGCNLCGSTQIEVLSLKDRHRRPLRTTICTRCGLVWSNPRPAGADVQRYYTSEYRQDYKHLRAPSRRHLARAARGAADRYRRLARFLRAGDRVLDVGCGGGELVYLLRREGIEAEGIEPDRSFAAYARDELGAPVSTGFVQDLDRAPESLDAIVMFHALEHVEDPSAVVARLQRWLKPGGWLLVEVPNVEARCQAPAHRFHFAHFYSYNTTTLHALGLKAGFGLDSLELSQDGGNITAVFRKSAPPGSWQAILVGNYETTVRTLRGHTTARHYLSRTPYVRALRRGLAYFSETRAMAGAGEGRALVDRILADSS